LASTYLKVTRVKAILNTLRNAFISIPLILAILGASGIFNVYQVADQSKDLMTFSREEGNISLGHDSRTGVYTDAFNAIVDNDAYLFGISPAGYHKTFLADKYSILRKGRLNTEVGILLYLMRGGLIFVLIVSLIHYYAAYYAINKSNNMLSKSLGIFIAFRYLFLFIEGAHTFTLYSISIFMVIGLCFNEYFRSLTDSQVTALFKRVV
jgi:hypothetical protein